jgi:hypothetical protein
MKKGSKHTEQTKEAISKAMEGNTSAEIWTLEEAEKLFDEALSIVKRKISYNVNGKNVDGYEFDFMGELVDELDVYRELITKHLPNRFTILKPKLDSIISKLETNCYSNTKKGIINTAAGIVNLKSNHKWTDRTENKNTNDTTINISPIKWVED